MSISDVKRKLYILLSAMAIPLIICVLPGLCTTALGIRQILAEYASTTWPTTEGKVIESRIYQYQSKGKTNYKPIVVYEYPVNGKTYSSDEISFNSTSGRKNSQDIVSQYPTGKNLKVYYNPTNPEKAVLEPGASWFNLPLLLSGIFLTFGLMGCLGELRGSNFITASTHQRLLMSGIGVALFVCFGWFGMSGVNNYCSELSQSNCNLLWGTAVISALGVILVIEVLLARKKAKGEWQEQERDSTIKKKHEPPSKTISRAFFISITRVLLVSLLAMLPLIIIGGFLSVFIGLGLGISIEALIRGIMGWFPPVEEIEV